MFTFTGRRNRRSFAVLFLSTFAGAIVFEIILNVTKQGSVLGKILGITSLIYFVMSFVLWLCIAKQRANDISGKNALIIFVLFGLFTPLFLLYMFIPSEAAVNKYGPIPR